MHWYLSGLEAKESENLRGSLRSYCVLILCPFFSVLLLWPKI